MKLFVWANPHHVRYGTSAYFAVAETEDEARDLCVRASGYSYVEFDQLKARGVMKELDGPPTRIVDVPVGEWHEWAE